MRNQMFYPVHADLHKHCYDTTHHNMYGMDWSHRRRNGPEVVWICMYHKHDKWYRHTCL